MGEAQAAIFVRYTDIEKDPYKCINQSDDDLNNFQIELENHRNAFFTNEEVLNKSSIYFSKQFESFCKILNKRFKAGTTKKPVKQVFLHFKKATKTNLSDLFVHLICSILGKTTGITLTNCRNQLRTSLEKNYIQFTAERNFDFILIKPSMW